MATAAHRTTPDMPMYQLALNRLELLTGRRLSADETVQLATLVDLFQYASFTGPERAVIADGLQRLAQRPGQARVAIGALGVLFR